MNSKSRRYRACRVCNDIRRCTLQDTLHHCQACLNWDHKGFRLALPPLQSASTSLIRLSAMDLSQSGIRVNMVSPTWVETPMLDGDRKKFPT